MSKMANIKEEPPVKKTPAQQYRELLERAEKMKGQAVEGLKTEIAEKITELNEYGYSYRLTDRPEYAPPPAKKTAGKTTTKQAPVTKEFNPDKKCPICQISGHDGRAHRSQGANKVSFTPAELEQMNLTPPPGTPLQQSL